MSPLKIDICPWNKNNDEERSHIQKGELQWQLTERVKPRSSILALVVRTRYNIIFFLKDPSAIVICSVGAYTWRYDTVREKYSRILNPQYMYM